MVGWCWFFVARVGSPVGTSGRIQGARASRLCTMRPEADERRRPRFHLAQLTPLSSWASNFKKKCEGVVGPCLTTLQLFGPIGP